MLSIYAFLSSRSLDDLGFTLSHDILCFINSACWICIIIKYTDATFFTICIGAIWLCRQRVRRCLEEVQEAKAQGALCGTALQACEDLEYGLWMPVLQPKASSRVWKCSGACKRTSRWILQVEVFSQGGAHCVRWVPGEASPSCRPGDPLNYGYVQKYPSYLVCAS